MSLRHLLPPDGVEELLSGWPDEPRVYQRGRTDVDSVITADWLWDHIDLGCVPPEEVRAVKKGVPSITAHAFSTHGRTDGRRLRGLYERGYTIRLGNLQRVMAVFGRISHEIQQETGCSNYVHAFMTAAGQQGLSHHWDQQMAVIVQLAGGKLWELWGPVVDSPMREVNESGRVWDESWIPGWEDRGPDLSVHLMPGESLLVPRGWVHNPSVPEDGQDSVHLTFAIRERTPYWLAEKILAGLIENPAMRRIIPPGELLGPGLPRHLEETCGQLASYLASVDVEGLAERVTTAALSELEYTT
ncbi:JmjC domain-containing protein [Streptomyces sp. NBC_00425]|uniref:JmjC domain-containing protein n=1 Tax=Streptomyces sp. NBC_00425 TaxID=2975740 RepID=UPI002E219835